MSALDLSTPVRLTWGPNANGREAQPFGRPRENAWTVRETTTGNLIQGFTVDAWERGPKDGRCFLQGALAKNDVPRKADAMGVNYLMVFDVDKGSDIDSTSAKLRSLGLAHLIYETHSSGLTHTDVKERDLKGDGSPEDRARAVVTRDDVTGVERIRNDDGMPVYRVSHVGQAQRFRVILFLSEPFEFDAPGRVREWKERYCDVGGWLGISFDTSCQDPSRLFYPPRIARDADEGAYQRFFIAGTGLDLDSVPRVASAPRTAPKAKTVALRTSSDARLVDDVAGPEFKTKGLKAWLAKHGRVFRPVDAMRARLADGEFNNKEDDKIEVKCPLADYHSEETATFPAFVAQGDGGWTFGCQHWGCNVFAGGDETRRGDRARFLDEWCQSVGIEDAADLVEFCAASAAVDVAAEIEKLAEGQIPDDATRERIFGLIADEESASKRDVLIQALKTRTGLSKRAIDADVRRLRGANPRGRGGAEPLGGPPAEGDEASAERIGPWGYTNTRRCVVGRLRAENQKSPHIFTGASGEVVRITRATGDARLEVVSTNAQWQRELHRVAKFYEDGNPDMGPRPWHIDMARGAGDELELPCLRAISRVPFFAADGKLRTERGYDAGTKTYLPPGAKFEALPAQVTQKDVDGALALLTEAVCDFPFSDAFDGDEKLRPGSPGRGVGSFTHWLAMTLQPFLGGLLDGPRPFYLVTKPKAGTGATMLVDDVCGVIWSGRKIGAFDLNGKPEAEVEKEGTARLMRGDDWMFFDNVEKGMDLPLLCNFATSGIWDGRILGTNKQFRTDFEGVVILAGNNPCYSHQMARRLVPILLNAAIPEPTRGRTFRHDDLPGWVKANRVALVRACHVLIAWWVQEGRPMWTGAPLASFEAWSRVMGGILAACGVPGFLSTTKAFQGLQPEAEGTVWPDVVGLVWDLFGEKEFAVRDLLPNVWTDAADLPIAGFVDAGYGGLRVGAAALHLGRDFAKFCRGGTFDVGGGKRVRVVQVRDRNPVRYRLVEV